MRKNAFFKEYSSEVSVIKCDDIVKMRDFNSINRYKAVKRAVKTLLENLGGLNVMIPEDAKMVLIKPNLVVATPPALHLTTDPHITASIAELLLEHGVKRVVVAEYPALIHKGRDVFETTLTRKFAEMAGAEIAYLDECELIDVEVEGAEVQHSMKIPKIVMDADAIIDVPKMKTHWLTKVTLGIKNLLGLLPLEDKIRFHREDVHQKLVDIFMLFKDKIALTLIDGMVAMEGLGPRCGELVPMGVLIASKDTVAADAVASYMMGFDPMEIEEIRIAQDRGLGNGILSKINYKGPSLNMLKRSFKRPSLDLVHVYKNVQVYIGGACIACKGFVKATLEALAREGTLKDNLTILLGKNPPVPRKLGDKVIVIGDCAKNSIKIRNSYVIEGCPPFMIYWKLPEILGVPVPLVLSGSHKTL